MRLARCHRAHYDERDIHVNTPTRHSLEEINVLQNEGEH